MGGSSLIKSAKIRRIVAEINNYKTSIYTFKAIHDRLPGDINNVGIVAAGIGDDSAQIYNDNTFGGKYVSTNADYGIPNQNCAGFVELYLEGIINFEPKKQNNDTETIYKGYCPSVYGYKNGRYHFDIDNNKNTFGILNKENRNESLIPPIIFEEIDKKIDDGKINSGVMVSYCSPNAKIWTGARATSWETAKMCVFNRIFYID